MSRDALEIATRAGGRTAVRAEELARLRSRLAGGLLRPGDAGWSDAVRLWNGMTAKSPALVARPGSAQDVAAVVRFAREHDLLLSVRGGGHHIAGTSIAEGGLTLDMSRMRAVDVEPGARLAHVEAGCRLREVDAATQEHGLATVLGFVSDTGVAGLTLGGGLGYLTRRFGWTVDNLEAVEIVTADGRIRTTSRDENADLFWAVRGAGANFGVVTRFTFRLHPVGPTVHGGLIAWPFERAPEILRAYRALTASAPRELAAWLVLLPAPPAPFVPEALHGAKLCGMAVCYSGDPARAEEALAPIRAIGRPVVDLLSDQPYAALQSSLDDGEPGGMHYYWRTEYLATLSDGLLDTLRELFATCPIPGADLGILHVGGALNERGEDDGAVGNRDAHYVVGVKGMWEPDESNAGAFRQWVRDAGARVRPFSTGRTYVNFQTADEGEERVRATYGANFDRLVQLKARYDPENVFRSNRNVPPGTGAAGSERHDGAAGALVA
jgi:FAD/FMN-containing dehydrogenase